MKTLGQLVKIRTGYTFRSAIDSFETGDVEVIQAKDIGADFGFALRPRIDFNGGEKHFLEPGEILVSARGYAKAVVYRGSNHKAVASSSLFVLRPRSDQISPEYIAMFFNSEQGVRAILRLSSGASVQSITKDNLAQIEIPEITASRERSLGNLIQAMNDYRSLLFQKGIYLDQLEATVTSHTLKEKNT